MLELKSGWYVPHEASLSHHCYLEFNWTIADDQAVILQWNRRKMDTAKLNGLLDWKRSTMVLFRKEGN